VRGHLAETVQKLCRETNRVITWQLNTTVKISAARVIQYMWVYGIGHFSTLRQLDRFRIAQQNLRNASKDSENPESADFDVFKRSISSKMADMKKMVETYNEELDKEQDISQHGKGLCLCDMVELKCSVQCYI
jgi:hypothetical protein